MQRLVEEAREVELLVRLHRYDLSFLDSKLRNEGLNPEIAVPELKKFLALSVLFDAKLRPSRQIDVAWHQLVLFTVDYRRFCEAVFGRIIEHVPDPDPLAATLAAYREVFGEPPAEMWGPRPAAKPDEPDMGRYLKLAAEALATQEVCPDAAARQEALLRQIVSNQVAMMEAIASLDACQDMEALLRLGRCIAGSERLLTGDK